MQRVLRVQTLQGEQTVPALLRVHWFRLKSDILWGKVRQLELKAQIITFPKLATLLIPFTHIYRNLESRELYKQTEQEVYMSGSGEKNGHSNY